MCLTKSTACCRDQDNITFQHSSQAVNFQRYVRHHRGRKQLAGHDFRRIHMTLKHAEIRAKSRSKKSQG